MTGSARRVAGEAVPGSAHHVPGPAQLSVAAPVALIHRVRLRAPPFGAAGLVVAAVASYYLAHEVMTWNEWLGGGLIIGAALIASFNHADE